MHTVRHPDGRSEFFDGFMRETVQSGFFCQGGVHSEPDPYGEGLGMDIAKQNRSGEFMGRPYHVYPAHGK